MPAAQLLHLICTRKRFLFAAKFARDFGHLSFGSPPTEVFPAEAFFGSAGKISALAVNPLFIPQKNAAPQLHGNFWQPLFPVLPNLLPGFSLHQLQMLPHGKEVVARCPGNFFQNIGVFLQQLPADILLGLMKELLPSYLPPAGKEIGRELCQTRGVYSRTR